MDANHANDAHNAQGEQSPTNADVFLFDPEPATVESALPELRHVVPEGMHLLPTQLRFTSNTSGQDEWLNFVFAEFFSRKLSSFCVSY
jgi:hypothetical protein